MKTIFQTWLKVEPNKKEKIKHYDDELLINNTLKLIKIFKEEIYNQASIRLYRNKTIPKKGKNFLKAIIPRLLELTSSTPENLIEKEGKQKINDLENIEEETI